MASYIESTLIRGEEIIYTGHISVWSLVPMILLGLLLLPLFGLGLIFWTIAFVRYKSTEVAITNKRVIAKFGFIRRKTIEMSLAKVESVQVDQGLLARLFDFGTLVVSGAGNPQAPIPGISDPMSFRRACMERLDQNLTPAVA
jgi:uncharacterized membrane protein YdbT with pleckstrin-like domain